MEDWRSILLNLISSGIWFAFGAVAAVAWRRGRRAIDNRATHNKLLRTSPRYAADWIRAYYDQSDRAAELFLVSTSLGPLRIASLAAPSWTFLEGSEPSLNGGDLARSEVKTRPRDVKRKSRHAGGGSSSGAVWNADILYVARITVPESPPPELELGICTYYQFLSTCGRLELETQRAVLGRRRTPLRDMHMFDLAAAAACTLGAQGLGAQVCLTFEMQDATHVILQERSRHVVTYTGAHSVAPVFACEPVWSGARFVPEWLWINFVREYLEEMHDLVELQSEGRHIASDWFMSHEEAKRLIEWRSAGSLEFRVLGVSIDALNGEVNLACNCHITAPEFSANVLPSLIYNWESSGYRTEHLGSTSIDRDLHGDRFQPGAAVALALTRRLLLKDD